MVSPVSLCHHVREGDQNTYKQAFPPSFNSMTIKGTPCPKARLPLCKHLDAKELGGSSRYLKSTSCPICLPLFATFPANWNWEEEVKMGPLNSSTGNLSPAFGRKLLWPRSGVPLDLTTPSSPDLSMPESTATKKTLELKV